MLEHFLEEQLKRIREMSEQMSRVRNRAAELSEEFERERGSPRDGPLPDLRVLRRHSSNSRALRRADHHGAGHSSRSTSRSRRK